MQFLILGATGNVGGALATQLVGQGHQVRALVRDASRAAGRVYDATDPGKTVPVDTIDIDPGRFRPPVVVIVVPD